MDKLGNDPLDLKLGRSYRDDLGFHTIRYDFKPASVDTSKIASVDLPLGSDGGVTVQVPHVEGASAPHTLFKGNVKENPRECVLIIDHKTGEITLEKLSSHIQLKKTRHEGPRQQAPNATRPPTPVEKKKQLSPKKLKTSHPNDPNTAQTKQPKKTSNAAKQPKSAEIVPEMSDSSSESSASDSDREDDECPPDIQQTQPSSRSSGITKHQSKSHSGNPQQSGHSGKSGHHPNPQKYALLSDDLRLSESGSDSD